jgi:aryl-phospho-beta-D-glucosidase BglC (GH1 family)
MKKQTLLLLTVFASGIMMAQGPSNTGFQYVSKKTTVGFLKAKDKVIVDPGGETMVLRGMGLGGWMLQEGYMFRLSQLGQQYRIKEKIAFLIGKEKTEEFYNKWLANHTTKADIDSMASWGFNSIRLPMHYRLYTLSVDEEPVAGKNTWLEKGFALTDSLVEWCRANNMYLILDLHAAPGGQGHDLPISDRDPSKPSLWQSKANQEKTIALWTELAKRYANEPAIGGYDIINEPNWGFDDSTDTRGTREQTNKPLRELMMQITKAIRSVDKNHIVIIEGNGFGNNYNGIFPLWDDNIVVSFHKYGTLNTPEGIKRFTDLQDQHNIPLWLGEAGENTNTWFTEAIALVESKNIGWCWWQEKKMGINNPLEIRITPSYQSLLTHWLNNGPKPSPEDAQKALNELLENIKIENNVLRRDVIDAMFRQVHSSSALPYQHQLISNGVTIKAVDFDYGRAGHAYKDMDTARYQYASPPMPSAGNRGGAYRNDGVDIRATERGGKDYYIFNIEDGEWWQYTINVAEPGAYNIILTVSSDSATGRVALESNKKPMGQGLPVNPSSSIDWKAIEFKQVPLRKGTNKLRVMAEKGGFNFREIKFIRRS